MHLTYLLPALVAKVDFRPFSNILSILSTKIACHLNLRKIYLEYNPFFISLLQSPTKSVWVCVRVSLCVSLSSGLQWIFDLHLSDFTLPGNNIIILPSCPSKLIYTLAHLLDESSVWDRIYVIQIHMALSI